MIKQLTEGLNIILNHVDDSDPYRIEGNILYAGDDNTLIMPFNPKEIVKLKSLGWQYDEKENVWYIDPKQPHV